MVELTAPRRRPWRLKAVLAVGGVAAVLVAVLVVFALRSMKAPSFPSLVDQPDPALHGTVVYSVPGPNNQWCLRLASASGAASRALDVCADPNIHQIDTLRWTSDGQIEVIDYGSIVDPQRGLEFRAKWHVQVDPATGAVTTLPTDDLPDATPAAPDLGVRGDRTVRTVSKDGSVTMTLTEPSGTRTIWTSKGRSNLWEVGQPLWSPDGSWLLAHDGADRLLLFTLDEPVQARILVTGTGGPFAITSEDLLG